jgi:hypothetical protein
MKILFKIIASFIFCIPLVLNAQTKRGQNFIVRATGDTLFCYNIDWSTNMQGYIVDLSYFTMDGKEVKLHKKKNIPIISCIHDAGKIYEIMPLKLKKPNSYYRVGQRVVDGKLKVSLFNSLHETQTFDPYDKNYQRMNGTSWKTTTSGTYLFYILMPDGKKYKINNSNMKKVIKPYLMQCASFVKEYKGEYSVQENLFLEMALLYNKLCK